MQLSSFPSTTYFFRVIEILFIFFLIKICNWRKIKQQCDQHHLSKRDFFSLYLLASFVIYQITIGVWVYLWAFYPITLVYISAFVPVTYCLDDYSFLVQSEVRELDSSNSVFLSKDCLVIWDILCFHTNCKKKICSNSVKNALGNLIGSTLNLQMALGSIVIFTILIFPI